MFNHDLELKKTEKKLFAENTSQKGGGPPRRLIYIYIYIFCYIYLFFKKSSFTKQTQETKF